MHRRWNSLLDVFPDYSMELVEVRDPGDNGPGDVRRFEQPERVGHRVEALQAAPLVPIETDWMPATFLMPLLVVGRARAGADERARRGGGE